MGLVLSHDYKCLDEVGRVKHHSCSNTRQPSTDHLLIEAGVLACFRVREEQVLEEIIEVEFESREGRLNEAVYRVAPEKASEPFVRVHVFK